MLLHLSKPSLKLGQSDGAHVMVVWVAGQKVTTDVVVIISASFFLTARGSALSSTPCAPAVPFCGYLLVDDRQEVLRRAVDGTAHGSYTGSFSAHVGVRRRSLLSPPLQHWTCAATALREVTKPRFEEACTGRHFLSSPSAKSA